MNLTPEDVIIRLFSTPTHSSRRVGFSIIKTTSTVMWVNITRLVGGDDWLIQAANEDDIRAVLPLLPNSYPPRGLNHPCYYGYKFVLTDADHVWLKMRAV